MYKGIHACFSGRFSRASLEGISFKLIIYFIFNVSLGSAPKRKYFDNQRNTRVGSGGQFTSNRLSNDLTFLMGWFLFHLIWSCPSCLIVIEITMIRVPMTMRSTLLQIFTASGVDFILPFMTHSEVVCGFSCGASLNDLLD